MAEKSEFKFWAADHKVGMTLEELGNALSRLEEGKKYRLRAKVDFGQQVQNLVFQEVEDEAPTSA
jgi:hypothetical protein